MAAVSSRVALLDPKRLEVLGLRIKAINSDLERQATLRLQQPAAAAEMDAKVRVCSSCVGGRDGAGCARAQGTVMGCICVQVQAIYDKMERWDPLVDTLPSLIDRLRALQQVHQDAATMVQAVKGVCTRVHACAVHVRPAR
jgi:hypothetical protein